jgi:hypothetical protein
MCNPLFILDEHRIGIEEACRLLGTAEKPAHPSTVLRAMNAGRKGPGGLAYLEHLHVGGKIVTSREAVERYLARLNGISPSDRGDPPEIPPRGKRHEDHLARVDAELTKLGI